LPRLPCGRGQLRIVALASVAVVARPNSNASRGCCAHQRPTEDPHRGRPGGASSGRSFAVLTVPVFVGGAVRPTASGAVLQPGRPSILIIRTDDQSTSELSAMSMTAAWFREGGTLFDRGYITTLFSARRARRSPVAGTSRITETPRTTIHSHSTSLRRSRGISRTPATQPRSTASSSPNGRTRRTFPASTASRSRRAQIMAPTSASTTRATRTRLPTRRPT
jgi:hypothetical protein